MEELSDKLGAILNNPEMMRSIFSMAQSLGQSAPAPPREEPPDPPMPQLDPALLQTIGSLAGSGTIDDSQRGLLSALTPYLSRERLNKLEKAMRAAKMAKVASVFLNSGGMQLITGR